MGVDYAACAGIGIDFDKETLKKLQSDIVLDEIEYIPEFLEDLLSESEHIVYGESGSSSYGGEQKFYLFAVDPINGVDDFMLDMYKLGLNINRGDLKFISEVLVY